MRSRICGQSLLAYAISFLLIGLIWANHQSMYIHIVRVDRLLMFLNTLLLMTVAFLPFPTAVLSQAMEHGDLKTAAVFYGLTLTVGGIFFNLVWRYACSPHGLIHRGISSRFTKRTSRRFLLGPVLYGLATLSAWFLPLISIGAYVALIIYFWLPPRGEAEELTR
jgi:uncharacterized membrane protein